MELLEFIEKAKKLIENKLGRTPSRDEYIKELHGAGLIILSDKITGPTGFEAESDYE